LAFLNKLIIRLHYSPPGNIFAGTGKQRNGRISGQPELDIRYMPSLHGEMLHTLCRNSRK